MLRVGVIGAGSHSTRNHGPALARYRDEHPDTIDLVAVCDLDRDASARYADRFGFRRTYASADRMLESEPLDALVAVTPVDATRDVVGSLLPQGVPLLIEKPPGRSVQEATALANIAATHGTPHAVSMNRRFNPALRRVRDWFEGRPATQRPLYAVGRLQRTDRTEAGFAKDTGIHAVDAVCSVLGRPTRVDVARWTAAGSAGSGHYGLGRVSFGDARASIQLLSDVGQRAETYDFHGPGVTASVDALGCACRAWVEGEQVLDWRIRDDADRYVRNGTYDETVAFLEAAASDRPFAPTLADVIPSLEVAAAIHHGRSRQVGRDRQ